MLDTNKSFTSSELAMDHAHSDSARTLLQSPGGAGEGWYEDMSRRTGCEASYSLVACNAFEIILTNAFSVKILLHNIVSASFRSKCSQ